MFRPTAPQEFPSVQPFIHSACGNLYPSLTARIRSYFLCQRVRASLCVKQPPVPSLSFNNTQEVSPAQSEQTKLNKSFISGKIWIKHTDMQNNTAGIDSYMYVVLRTLPKKANFLWGTFGQRWTHLHEIRTCTSDDGIICCSTTVLTNPRPRQNGASYPPWTPGVII